MALVVIAVKHAAAELRGILEKNLLSFCGDGFVEDLAVRDIGGWPHLFCHLREGDAGIGTCSLSRQRLARLLAGFVVDVQASHYLEEMLVRRYFYFPSNERHEISHIAKKICEKEKKRDNGRALYFEVEHAISSYLLDNDYLNLHGMLLFRFGALLEHLQKWLNQAVDEFLMEKEYQDFIKLLKYFVELQEPKINQVHVTLNEHGEFTLLDQSYQHIDSISRSDWDNSSEGKDREDLLVSTLITVAPHRIILHRKVYTLYPKAADTLRHVFEKRVTLCRRCKLCHDVSSHLYLKGKP